MFLAEAQNEERAFMKNYKKMSPKALAQAIALSTVTMAASAQDFAIEEIVVTAQKRAESLQDVPVAVSAMDAGDLETLKLQNSTEIADQIPNVQIQKPFGDAQPVFAVRGVSMSDFSQNQSSPVALYIDEVYRGAPALQGIQMFDLERVEVLRGPQGTLFGKNTTGGAVNFHTRKPNFEEGGYISAGFGNYNRFETKGAYETTLIEDTLAIRGAFTYTESDGYVENKLAGADDQSETDNWAGRISLRYTPTETLDAVLTYSKSRATPTHAGAMAINITGPTTLPVIGPVPGGVGFFTGYNRAGLDYYENESNFSEDRKHEVEGLSLTVNWDFDEEHTLTSVTSYDEGTLRILSDDDGSPATIIHTDIASDVRAISQDLRVSSDYVGPFNWIAGIYYATETLDAANDYDIGFEMATALQLAPAISATDECTLLQLCSASNKYTQVRNSIAAYTHTTYDLSEELTLTFGLRYSEDDNQIDDLSSARYGFDGATQTQVFIDNPIENIENVTNIDRSWSGKVGLDYALNEDTLLYISYSEGYRSGSYNGQAFFDPSELNYVDPEEIEAWEVGVKTQLLDGRVQLNGAVFQYDYTNQQFIQIDGFLQRLVNADESQIRGAELEMVARVTEPMTIKAGVGYLDSEFKEATVNGVDLSGNELVSTPEWNLNLSIDYDVITADWGTVTAHVDGVYVDEQFFDAFNTEGLQEDAYWISNARLSYYSADDVVNVALWVKNIENRHYSPYRVGLQDEFGFDFATRGTPRTFGAEVTWNF
jgi:iron complex outermembrane recepter protein